MDCETVAIMDGVGSEQLVGGRRKMESEAMGPRGKRRTSLPDGGRGQSATETLVVIR